MDALTDASPECKELLPTTAATFFQHFRLVQEDVNDFGTHNFCVSSFEVYGRALFVRPTAPMPAKAQLHATSATLRKSFDRIPPPPQPKAPEKSGGKKKQ